MSGDDIARAVPALLCLVAVLVVFVVLVAQAVRERAARMLDWWDMGYSLRDAWVLSRGPRGRRSSKP